MDCRIRGRANSCCDSSVSFHSSKYLLSLKSWLGIPALKENSQYAGYRKRVNDRMKHQCGRVERACLEGVKIWAKTWIVFFFLLYFGLVSINVFGHLPKLTVH